MKLGRRRFLTAIAGLTAVLSLKPVPKAFGWVLQGISSLISGKANASEQKSRRALVIYYSATGNTGQIANAIYRGMKSVMPCDVAPIEKMDPKDVAKYDLIAIGGPVWHFRETANVMLYMYKIPLLREKLAVLFCTHESHPMGMFYNLEMYFKKKGATVIGWNDWYGACNIVLHIPEPSPIQGHPDEIDIKEAEVFGREMAERALRIYAGERDLIPEIPRGPEAHTLWHSPVGRLRGHAPGGGFGSDKDPAIDMTKCVYPRCTACVDLCPGQAIDLSMMATAAQVDNSPILVKGCLHCSPAPCIRICTYDAVILEEGIAGMNHVIDMNKCTYPKCTLCVDYCTMGTTIDFSENPPVFHNNCEGCDVCYALCPTRAIQITNLDETHEMMGAQYDPNSPEWAHHGEEFDSDGNLIYKGFYESLNEDFAKGKYRQVWPIDKIGWKTILLRYADDRIPLWTRNEEYWPHHIDEE